MTPERAATLSLFGVPGVGPKTYALLVKAFGSPVAVFEAEKHELTAVEGVGPVTAESIVRFERERFVGEQERRMKQAGARMLVRSDEEYPALLNVFPSAPQVLFVRGDTSCLNKTTLAFVGTRKPTSYGLKMTRKLAAGAVNAGACVVSGMAAGIDSEAHRTAVEEGGTTAAVFGCGVDVIYPSFNRGLAKEIEKSGCLVSHFPMGTSGVPGNFPARNSVIVGLSLVTIVVEAPEKSGALITAELTLRAGRKLFTVPGPADSSKSEGTNNLLGRGAQPVSSIETVMSLLGKAVPAETVKRPERPLPAGLAGEILGVIEREPLHIEKICLQVKRGTPEVLSELTLLEIDGYVSQLPGKMFERR